MMVVTTELLQSNAGFLIIHPFAACFRAEWTLDMEPKQAASRRFSCGGLETEMLLSFSFKR